MKPSKATIIRTVILALALVNQGMQLTGKSILPIEDENISSVVTFIFTVCASIIAWWKNNSFTRDAIGADLVMKYKCKRKRRK